MVSITWNRMQLMHFFNWGSNGSGMTESLSIQLRIKGNNYME